jgi:hypothetical protein
VPRIAAECFKRVKNYRIYMIEDHAVFLCSFSQDFISIWFNIVIP